MRVSVDRQQPKGDVLAQAGAVLARHGIVAYPTETFYGLGASVFDVEACERVFFIKGRPASKALPCIVSDIADLERISSAVPRLAYELGARFWPGPLTLIIPARAAVAAASEEGTIAVRVSSLPLARELAALAGPMTATSANASGSPPAVTADEVMAQLPRLDPAVDLVLDAGRTEGGVASTIVDVTSGRPRLVRKGAISFRAVNEP